MTALRIQPGTLLAAGLAVGLGFAAAELGTKALALVIAAPCAVLLLAQPRWSFWLLIASIPVTVDFGSGLTVTRLVIPLVVASIVGNAILRRCPWPNPVGSPAALTGTLFFVAIALSVATASLMHGALVDGVRVNKEFTGYVTRMVLFLLTLGMVRSDEDVRDVTRVMVIAGVIEALVVMAQVHFRLVLPGDWRSTAINNVEGTSGDFRAEGTTPHPIYLAGYLQMVLPFAMLVGLQARLGGRLLALGAVALLMYAWSAAVSRSSMLGLVAMAATALCIWSRVGRALVIGCAVALVLALAVHGWSLTDLAQTIEHLRNFGSHLRADQLTSSAGSLQFRMESSVGGWNLFLAHPLTGVGLGQALYVYMAFLPIWADSPFHPQDIHNAFVGVAAEAGLLALLTLLALWAFALRGVQAAWRDPVLGPYARTLLVVLVGQLVFVCLTPMVRDMWFTVAFGAALGQIMKHKVRTRPAEGPSDEAQLPGQT
ncbi:MAG: O-antigen ligase family protein [Burkholderiaceae bacterium]|nr:O-antigen ligase family protein [Burkholderiaceae bacterium]